MGGRGAFLPPMLIGAAFYCSQILPWGRKEKQPRFYRGRSAWESQVQCLHSRHDDHEGEGCQRRKKQREQ